MIWHFMQIVTLHEMSDNIFEEKLKQIFQHVVSLNFTSMLRVNLQLS